MHLLRKKLGFTTEYLHFFLIKDEILFARLKFGEVSEGISGNRYHQDGLENMSLIMCNYLGFLNFAGAHLFCSEH